MTNTTAPITTEVQLRPKTSGPTRIDLLFRLRAIRSRPQFLHRERADGRPVAGDDAAVIVELPKMVREVGQQGHDELLRLNRASADLLGIRLRQFLCVERADPAC